MAKYILPLFLLTSVISLGQGLNIKFDLKPAANKQIYLAHYYINNIYIDDTLKLDGNGTGTLVRDTLLPQGLYKIYLDDKHHFDFLMGEDQEFTLANETFSANNLKISGAKETEEFVKYVVFLKGMKKRSAEIRENLKTASEKEQKKLKKEMEGLNPKMLEYWKKTSTSFPNTFLAKFLMSNNIAALDMSTISEEIQNNDSLLLLARFNYQKAHFWDHFDYTDERFLYTPVLKPKLETWFTKVLYQNYDSVKTEVIQLIENTRPHKRVFQFVTSFFLNASINSNIMGMDALFVDIAKKYYLSGEAFWASDKSMEKIRENVLFAEKNLIGLTAPDLNLESVDGEYFSLHQIEKKITLLLIYEPNCSHCKEFVPELYNKIYLKYKEKGVEVFAIYSMDNKEEWTDFLTKFNLFEWINVWDQHHISRFKITYDARKTPGIYVLDENKTIIAKKMTIEQLDKLLEFELN